MDRALLSSASMSGRRRQWVRAASRAAMMTLCVAGGPAVAHAQIDPATALLAQAGWRALSTDQARVAARVFGQALARDPDNSVLHMGAAAAAYARREDAGARAHLARVLTLSPRTPEAWTLLARIAYREGRLSEAIATLERAAESRSLSPDAGAALERWRREAALHDGMRRIVGPRFTILFRPEDAGEAFATRVIEALDRAYWRIGAELGVYPLANVPVVIYSAPAFVEVTQLPGWALGAYDGTIRVPMRAELDDPEELDALAAHEFTHVLVRTLAPHGVPAWLDEGLATALASADFGWAERAIQVAPRPLPVADLTASFSRLDGDHARPAYAASALVARQLLADAGGVGVANVLRDVAAGIDLDSALRRRANRSLAELDAGAARR